MKKLILVALMAMGTSFVQAQTKGTNTLGFGVNLFTSKNSSDNETQLDQKSTNESYSLSFGHFLKENQKLSLNLSHQSQSYNTDNKIKGYGIGLSYQKYYPIFKSFYAFAGGGGNYMFMKDTRSTSDSKWRSNNYSANAFGGLSWFVSKRIALEVDLLSVGAQFGSSKSTGSNSSSSSKFTAFNFSTAGAAGNYGFRVHILF